MTLVDVLALVGTIVSSAMMLPHLNRALRTTHSLGSPIGWLIGALGSTSWMMYGLTDHNMWAAAPNFFIAPMSYALVFIAIKRRNQAAPAVASIPCQRSAAQATAPTAGTVSA